MNAENKNADGPEEQGEGPNPLEGVIAIVASAILLAIVVFVPPRQGAAPGNKYYLMGLALILLGWGIRRIKLAKRKK